jgi:methylenetetrahydrofolate reductase (NADPH)
MAFDRHSNLRDRLRGGDFSVLLELASPTAAQPLKRALLPGAELARLVESDDRLAGLAVTEGFPDSEPCHPIPAVVRELQAFTEKDIVPYVVGRGLTVETLRSQLATLKSARVATIAAVTGYGSPAVDDTDPRTPPFMDSTALVHHTRETDEFFVGATVNPFKYTIADSCLQYLKMVKKLNSGASFVVAEAGWDMAKYQELQWFLRARALADPVLARLLYVRGPLVPRLLDGNVPGIVMTRELATRIQREAKGDEDPVAASCRRLALQIVGCRILGYSGVQLAGIPDGRTVSRLLDAVDAATAACVDYDSWLAAWSELHDRVSMAPYPHLYYAYRELLSAGAAAYDPQTTRQTDAKVDAPERSDLVRLRLAECLGLGPSGRSAITRTLRRLLCRAQRGDWQFHMTGYVSPEICPKQLDQGPCAGTAADGTCELAAMPCIYHRVLALKHQHNQVDILETAYAPTHGHETPDDR